MDLRFRVSRIVPESLSLRHEYTRNVQRRGLDRCSMGGASLDDSFIFIKLPQANSQQTQIGFFTTMAAAIEPTWMAALFRPTNRCRDHLRERYGNESYELPQGLTEVEILPDLSPEHVQVTDIMWEDFYRVLGGKTLVWMGPDVYVCAHYINHLRYELVLQLGTSNRQGPSRLHVYAARGSESAAATTATCNFLVRLLATSKANEAFIGSYGYYSVPISGPTLSQFFQENQGNLQKVTFGEMILNEEQIHALATTTESRTDMEVILSECNLLPGPDCHAAFVECLHRDGGPTQLDKCEIDCDVLAAALEGNSRVTRIKLASGRSLGNYEMDVIFRSLAENKGLVELDVAGCSITDENWTVLCHSVKGHPALTILDLRGTYRHPWAQWGVVIKDKEKAQRTRVLAETVEESRVLHTVRLNQEERDEQIYVESILPHIETNLFRPRVLGIKKLDIVLRRAVLGLALQTESVRNKSNLLWMFLSENQDVVLQSDEESAAVLQSDEESDVVLQSDEESSEQEEEVTTCKRKL
jgi:hypothetical protein